MPVTTNRAYNVPATGADPGTWGAIDLNPNFAAIDTNLGGVQSIALASTTPVTLASSEYANGTIRFSGTLTQNILVLFPNVQGWWTVENLCTGAFYVAVRLASGGNQIGLPPGEAWDVLADGTNMKYRNLPHPIGGYWDDCGTGVPDWVTACTVPPYLLCDGSTFSAVTYPFLNTKLGGTTLPDLRGRVRATLNGGTNRITTAGSGIDGDARLSAGGAQNLAISQANFPVVNFAASGLTVAGSITLSLGSQNFYIAKNSNAYTVTPGATDCLRADNSGAPAASFSLTASGNVPSGGSGTAFNEMPPTCIGGVTMIRAGG